ncbi:MAG: PstS family phosphate ABC transporter substrate-binding protein [Coriobacteriia bacterium]|nr:PstS family phosphate ABC transporter substrate-binding protein [Coriobacteriia bacterium]
MLVAGSEKSVRMMYTHKEEMLVKLRKWLMISLAAMLATGALAAGGCSSKSTSTDTNTSGSTKSTLSGTIKISGSDTMVNMAQAWAEKFNTENPGVVLTVAGGGSGVGIAAFLNKTVDFANASRKLKDAEKSQATTAGLNAVTTVVAKDAVTIIVNSANTMKDITKEQLGKIYRGEITNWKDVGGKDATIVLLGRDSSSGTYSFIQDEIIGSGKTYAKSMRNLQSNQAIVDEVSKNADAIGYVGLGYDNSSIKVLTCAGVTASVDTVLNGTYPLSRDLNMISNGQPTGVMKAYIDWILGTEGQKIVAEQGFVPLKK